MVHPTNTWRTYLLFIIFQGSKQHFQGHLESKQLPLSFLLEMNTVYEYGQKLQFEEHIQCSMPVYWPSAHGPKSKINKKMKGKHEVSMLSNREAQQSQNIHPHNVHNKQWNRNNHLDATIWNQISVIHKKVNNQQMAAGSWIHYY